MSSQVVGHEIVGVAVKVGSKVTHVKEGDIVGVGAQSDSCQECEQCTVSLSGSRRTSTAADLTSPSFFSSPPSSSPNLSAEQKDREPYCLKGQVGTYAGKYYREGPGKGDKSYGGYADYHRSPGHFVVKIPDGLDPAIAAPMLCGGATVYSPLKEYGAGTTAKDVGIVGIGGLVSAR